MPDLKLFMPGPNLILLWMWKIIHAGLIYEKPTWVTDWFHETKVRVWIISKREMIAHWLLKQNYSAIQYAIEFKTRRVKYFLLSRFLTAFWLHFNPTLLIKDSDFLSFNSTSDCSDLLSKACIWFLVSVYCMSVTDPMTNFNICLR